MDGGAAFPSVEGSERTGLSSTKRIEGLLSEEGRSPAKECELACLGFHMTHNNILPRLSRSLNSTSASLPCFLPSCEPG